MAKVRDMTQELRLKSEKYKNELIRREIEKVISRLNSQDEKNFYSKDDIVKDLENISDFSYFDV